MAKGFNKCKKKWLITTAVAGRLTSNIWIPEAVGQATKSGEKTVSLKTGGMAKGFNKCKKKWLITTAVAGRLTSNIWIPESCWSGDQQQRESLLLFKEETDYFRRK
jgi:hypothetical protein